MIFFFFLGGGGEEFMRCTLVHNSEMASHKVNRLKLGVG